MDQILKTSNAPRRNIVGNDMHSTNVVRVCRESPESVFLQLRRTKDYSTISLSFAEATELAAMPIAAVGGRK